jgi:hypothetical protein
MIYSNHNKKKGTEMEKTQKAVPFIDWKLIHQITKNDPKASKYIHELDELHHKYRGKQSCLAAHQIRSKLRRKGIYLSKMGHEGRMHD